MIFGLDIDPTTIFKEDRIRTELCNASDNNALIHTVNTFGTKFSLIIDDASHNENDQILALDTLLPYLTDDGIMIVEDVVYYANISDHLNTKGIVHNIVRFEPNPPYLNNNLIIVDKSWTI